MDANETSGALILVLEDEVVVAMELELRLREMGYRVAGPVTSHAEALEAAARAVPDLLLADIHIAGPFDGIETAAVLQRDYAVPTVYLTAHADPKTMRRAIATLPYGYLTKPLRESELRATLESALLRHRMGGRLRRREEQLAEAQRLGRLGSWEWRAAGNRFECSDELLRIFEVTREELEREGQQSMVRRVVEEDRAALAEALRSGWRTTGEVWHEYRIRLPDGSLRYLRSHLRTLRDPDGKVVRQHGVTQDITERTLAEQTLRASEEALRESQRLDAIGRLAGGVAHDFNNMLTVILSLASALEGMLESDPEARDLVREVQSAGRRASDLTRQLLAFARRQLSSPRVLDLDERVGAFRRFLERTLGEDARLEIVPCPGLWSVRLDPSHVEQLLLNLAINARDAMPDGGTITITTRNVERFRLPGGERGAGVELAVSDTGRGMPPEVMERVFEPFFTTKELGRGTGLGLATVYGIVKQGEGEITVESELGRGTTVRVWFPRHEAAPEPLPKPEGGAPAPGARDGEHIVLVEDEPAVRSVARRILEGAGYRVRVFESATEASRALPQLPRFDLLLTDVVMPGESGPALANRLLSERPEVPVLFMSGYSNDQLALGRMGRLIHKPFTREALLEMVRSILDG